MDNTPPTEQDALLHPNDIETPSSAAPSDDNSSNNNTKTHRKIKSVDFAGGTKLPPPARFGGLRRAGRHQKHHSIGGNLSNSMRNLLTNLEPIREDLVENVSLVRHTFVHELDRMDQGETGFLDMSLTRSLSIIPDDIDTLVEETGIRVQEELATGPPVVQYAALLSAVVAISSNATALHMLEGVQAPMKLFWRMTASYMVLSLFAIRTVHRDGLPQLSVGMGVTFLAAVTCYTVQGLLFMKALDYTAISNVLIFANSQALLLIVGKAFVGERIHVLEGMGVVVAFSGAILCAREESSAGASGDADKSYIGDFLALGSAVCGVGYLTFAKAVRSKMPVTLFLFSVMFVGSFLILLYMMIDPSMKVEFNLNPYDGIVGWWNVSRLPILIYLALIVNCVGTMGFVRGTSASIWIEYNIQAFLSSLFSKVPVLCCS